MENARDNLRIIPPMKLPNLGMTKWKLRVDENLNAIHFHKSRHYNNKTRILTILSINKDTKCMISYKNQDNNPDIFV